MKPTPFIYLAFEKSNPFIFLIIQNVDLFIYCPLVFYAHLLPVRRNTATHTGTHRNTLVITGTHSKKYFVFPINKLFLCVCVCVCGGGGGGRGREEYVVCLYILYLILTFVTSEHTL